MPLNGSSIMSTGGSPSMAAAIPSRCRMPREYPPALRLAAVCSPACSITASTRRAVRPCEWASQSRWLRALRLGCSAAASSKAPTWLSGCRRLAYGWPPTSAVPSSGASRPRITRIVVDFPAPLGPTNPVTWPGWTVKVIPSRAMVVPKRLRSPATSIVASMPGRLRSRGGPGRHAGEPSLAPLARGSGSRRIPLTGDSEIPGQGDVTGLASGDNGWCEPSGRAGAVDGPGRGGG